MSSRPKPKVTAAAGSRGYGSRATSRDSFHAGAPIPTLSSLRRAASNRYQTFPSAAAAAPAPKTPNEQAGPDPADSDASSDESSTTESQHGETPLPVKQLLLLAFLSLSEQTALNSISPYLPEMVASMPGIRGGDEGLYVGILASAFALAQLSTNFIWGYASDVVGRKPCLLLGTFALMCCFAVFGLCTEYWQVVVVHVAMGMLNGNAACVPTVLGEVTDRSNQSRAFQYLPVIYSLGSITGPAVGGVLVGSISHTYPYLGPNVLGAALLAVSVVVVAIWFQETLDEEEAVRPAWLKKVSGFFMRSSKRSSWSTRWPTTSSRPLLSSSASGSSADEAESDQEDEHIKPDDDPAVWKEILNRTTVLILLTYLVFQLGNISFNSLYPIFASTDAPIGRDLGPGTIGLSLSLAGCASIIFQAFLFQVAKARLGNLGVYRFAILGIAISMILMPWVGYKDSPPLLGIGTGKIWLYIELGFVLILKNICAVGGLSSVMLLITNSAPSHNSLGTLNGVAQTLSALGRSFGPFVSGGLFTLSMNVHPKGEALAWCLFGGLALVGFAASLFIKGAHLESEEDQSDDEGQDTSAVA